MEISLAAEKIGQIGALPITNSMLTGWIGSAILIIFATVASYKMKIIPSGVQNVFEYIIEFLYNTADSIIGDEKQTRRYFPLVATIFLFIIFNNWLGLIPGVGTIGLHETFHGKEILVPLFRSANADLNMTIALAVITVLSIQIFGIAAIGFFKYGKKFINLSSPINFFIGILELIGEVSRMISFSFRLFGNVFAGEVLLVVIAFIVPYIAPIPFYGLEIFVGFIQALVFTMLALVFIKSAITDHEAH
ncbi:MAG: F0F1 ATP synthase subunit A [Candidatus Berkelbacteria bacterium]